MSERPDELERILADLAPRVRFPPTPDLAAPVHAALVAEQSAERARRGWTVRRWPALAAAIVLVVLIGVAAIPRARHAVADWLGLPGIHIVIERGHPRPTATPQPGGVTAPGLLFGTAVPLDDLARVAGFPVRVPSGVPLGQPAGAYVRRVEAGTMVSLLYRPGPGLPAVAGTGVGAYLMELQTGRDVVWMIKSVPSANIQHVLVDGQDAFWLTGAQVYFNPDPSILPGQEVPARESGNVLLWAKDGVTYRLETKLDQAQAIAVAESLMQQPAPASPTAGVAPNARLAATDRQQPARAVHVASVDIDHAVDDER